MGCGHAKQLQSVTISVDDGGPNKEDSATTPPLSESTTVTDAAGGADLVGDAGRSPYVRAAGSRSQPSVGLALSYTFGGE